MPSYKTHSIHSQYVLPVMDKRINIYEEDMKLYSIGPDALIPSDMKTFERQHMSNVRDYFFIFNK